MLNSTNLLKTATFTKNAEFFKNNILTQEASGSFEDLKVIQDENMHPSKNSSLHHDDDKQEIVEPQSDVNPIRRNKRKAMHPDSMCLICRLQHGSNELWLFKKKTNMDGNVHAYKARLISNGFTQTNDVDYEETFSPVENIRAIRILIAITTFYDYEIWQMDVKTAFLNRHLSKEVYMVKHQDDLLIRGNHVPMLQDVESYLGKCIAMEDLGEATYIS
ncbi:retrotransposon protein, putative, ty1-copia subclass [Tanacetum coccineum]